MEVDELLADEHRGPAVGPEPDVAADAGRMDRMILDGAAL